MKSARFFMILSLIAGCESTSTYDPTIWQTTPVISLLNGVYDGQLTVADVKKHGDQGVGTWNQLNGEGIILDGRFYQVHSDGTVHEKTDGDIMPFAQVNFFRADRQISIPSGIDYDSLQKFVDVQLETVNAYYALQLKGSFMFVQTRSLPKQSKPYPPFWKVELTEPKFEFSNESGTMVGFRSPPYSVNFDPPGYHFHFLNEDLSGGGHVLKLLTDDAVLHLQRVNQVSIALPTLYEFDTANLSSIDQPPSMP